MRTLDRRLRHFNIYYHDKNVTVENLEDVVEELDGPGKLLGYRALHKKIRQQCHLRVPRDLVHATMYDLDPAGFENRTPRYKAQTEYIH